MCTSISPPQPRDCLSLPTATMRTAQADRAHLLSFLPSFLLFLIFIRASAVIADTFNTVPVTWTTTPFNGRSIPLHVKGPCNNVWQSQGNHTAPANLVWPRLWDFNHDVRPLSSSGSFGIRIRNFQKAELAT